MSIKFRSFTHALINGLPYHWSSHRSFFFKVFFIYHFYGDWEVSFVQQIALHEFLILSLKTTTQATLWFK